MLHSASTLVLLVLAAAVSAVPVPQESASQEGRPHLSASEKVEHFVVGSVDSVGDTAKGVVHGRWGGGGGVLARCVGWGASLPLPCSPAVPDVLCYFQCFAVAHLTLANPIPPYHHHDHHNPLSPRTTRTAGLHPIDSAVGAVRAMSNPAATGHAIFDQVAQAYEEDPARAAGYTAATALQLVFPFYSEVAPVRHATVDGSQAAVKFAHDSTFGLANKFMGRWSLPVLIGTWGVLLCCNSVHAHL